MILAHRSGEIGGDSPGSWLATFVSGVGGSHVLLYRPEVYIIGGAPGRAIYEY
jgi:hypothetical protein